MRIIAHRGLSWQYPENTLLAFAAAAEARADLIELDYHTTRDGKLVCLHDETLDRYVGTKNDLAGRSICDLNFPLVLSADMGSWKGDRFAGLGAPLLRDALDSMRPPNKPVLLLERKTGTVQQTLRVLDEASMADRVIVQSFDWAFLAELRTQRPRLRLAALGSGELSAARQEQVRALGALAAHWQDTDITSQTVAVAHAAGIEIWGWTIDSEMAFRGAAAMGIDGITTNRCDYARRVLGRD